MVSPGSELPKVSPYHTMSHNELLISHSPKYLHGPHPPSPHCWFMCIAVALCCPLSCPPHVSPTHLACILPTHHICILPTLQASRPPHVCCRHPAHLMCIASILPVTLCCPPSGPPHVSPTHLACVLPTHHICIQPTSCVLQASSSPCACHGHPASIMCILPTLLPAIPHLM